MFDNFKNMLRKAVGSLNNYFNGAIDVYNPTSTDDMSSAISLWMDMYTGKAPWLTDNKQSIGLPAAIASEMARLVTLEMECNIKPPENSSSERADYLNEQLKPFLRNIRQYCEYACAGGGMMFKPYIDGKTIAIDCVRATDFKPLGFDSKGEITSCVFIEHKKQKDAFYHRIEKHEFREDGKYVVTNRAYKSMTYSGIGKEIPLTDIPEWKSLIPEQVIDNITSPLFAYFKIPLGNTVDPTSPLGVSVYARAVDLIEDADRQYQRFLWEFEGGELAIEASKDIFPLDRTGRPILPSGKERLYRPNELDDQSGAELIKTFSPDLREEQLKNGLNLILQKIEFSTGLAYGTLSDPQTVDRTATEINASKQRSYSTITDIQKALQNTIEHFIYAMDAYTTLYKLAPEGEHTTSFAWDDSIVVDTEAERQRDMNEVRMGLMQKWEYRVKWFGEDKETAKKAVEGDSQLGNPFGLT